MTLKSILYYKIFLLFILIDFVFLASSCVSKKYYFSEEVGSGFILKKSKNNFRFYRKDDEINIGEYKDEFQLKQLSKDVFNYQFNEEKSIILDKNNETQSSIFFLPLNYYQSLGRCGLRQIVENSRSFSYYYVSDTLITTNIDKYMTSIFGIKSNYVGDTPIAFTYIESKTGIPIKFDYIYCKFESISDTTVEYIMVETSLEKVR